MTLNPGEYFTIVRQLPDPNDSATYYVRAEIRNARTDELIETVALADRGSRRFSQPWKVPFDTTGLGFYISVLTAVYTDPSYTTPSDVYSQEIQTYLVDNRFRNLGGGGGGDSVDYKKLAKVLHDELSKIEQPELDLSPVMTALEQLSAAHSGIIPIVKRSDQKLTTLSAAHRDLHAKADALLEKEPPAFPEIPTTDLSPVLSAINDLPSKLPKHEPTDLTPLTSSLEALRTSLDAGTLQKLAEAAAQLQQVLISDDFKTATEKIPSIAESVGNLENNLKDFLYVTQKQRPEPKEPAKPDYHANARALIGMKK